jgi:dihydrofolate reductase/acyl-CoA hydrolase
MLAVLLLSVLPQPLAALAANSKLKTLEFVSDDDDHLLVGESSTIRFRVYDETHTLYSGTLKGYLWNTVTGGTISLSLSGSGSYTASDVVIDAPGAYGLFISDLEGNELTAPHNITVREVAAALDGALSVNMTNTVTVRLTDSDGAILSKKSITVDGTEAGASSQNYTTLSDGTFTFTMTPTQIGKVKFIFGGQVIKTVEVTDQNVGMEVSGQLVLNAESRLSVRLTDADGEPIGNKSFSVDATAVGLNTASYTTLNDGTATVLLTPTKIGVVNLIFGGRVLQTLEISDLNVAMEVSGKLVLNVESRLAVRLTDAGGVPMGGKSFSVDATEAGLNTGSYTTLNDGTATFLLTPNKMGAVHLIFGGQVLRTVVVDPAYIQGQRIGEAAADNASLSLAIAQNGWTDAENVVLTRDDAVADAMVAAPLAAKLAAPILMTPVNELLPSIEAELRRLGARNVYIIGGTGAISATVEDRLKQTGVTVIRIAGADRYQTAAEVAVWLGGENTDTAYLAYGYGEPDALAASAFAAQQGAPILLTETNQLPPATRQALQNMGAAKIKLLGGTGVISTLLESQLAGQYQVSRYGGLDRFATEVAIFQGEFTDQSPLYFTSALVDSVNTPSGQPFGDALLTAALAARNHGFVVTLPLGELPSNLYYFLLYNKGYISTATVVGNRSAVSQTLENQLHALLTH